MKIKKRLNWIFSSFAFLSLISVISVSAVACSSTNNIQSSISNKPNNELNPSQISVLNPTTFKQLLKSNFVGQFYNNGVLDLAIFNNLKQIQKNTFTNFNQQYDLNLSTVIINNSNLEDLANVFDTHGLIFLTANKMVAQNLYNLKTDNKIYLNNVLYQPNDIQIPPETSINKAELAANIIPASLVINKTALAKLSAEQATNELNWNTTIDVLQNLIKQTIIKNIDNFSGLNFSIKLASINNDQGIINVLVSVNGFLANHGLTISVAGFKIINLDHKTPNPISPTNKPEVLPPSKPPITKPQQPQNIPSVPNKPNSNNNQDLLDYIKQPGIINNTNLLADQYAAIVSILNLHNFTILSQLTDQNLNKLLQQSEFYDVKVEIANGSNEKLGLLILNLSGSYILNGKQILIPNQTSVQISGFYNLNSTNWMLNLVNNNAYQTEFNLNNFFKNFQTISSFNKPESFVSWAPYFQSFYVSFISGELPVDFIKLFNANPDGFDRLFTNFKLILNKNQTIQSISFLWTPQVFNNNQWTNIKNPLSDKDGFTISINNANTLKVPSKTDALLYYLSQFEPNPNNNTQYPSQAVLKNLIPSTNESIVNAIPTLSPEKFLVLNPDFNLKEFEKIYFNNETLRLSLVSDNNSLISNANDLEGTLSYTVSAKIDNNAQTLDLATREFNLTNFKKLTNLNILNIYATLNNNSSSFKMIVNFIKNHLSEINNNSEIKVTNLLPFISVLSKPFMLFNFDASLNGNENTYNSAKRIFNVLKFNQYTILDNLTNQNNFNYANGLIDNLFAIKNIAISTMKNNNGIIKKVNGYYVYSCPINVSVTYYGQEITYQTSVTVNIHNLNLNKI